MLEQTSCPIFDPTNLYLLVVLSQVSQNMALGTRPFHRGVKGLWPGALIVSPAHSSSVSLDVNCILPSLGQVSLLCFQELSSKLSFASLSESPSERQFPWEQELCQSHASFPLCPAQWLELKMHSTDICRLAGWMDPKFPINITSAGEETVWAQQNVGVSWPEKRTGDRQNSNKKSLAFTEYLLCARHSRDTMHTRYHLILTAAKLGKDYFFSQWLSWTYSVPRTWWGTGNTKQTRWTRPSFLDSASPSSWHRVGSW